jgi:hypothetical protein
LEDIYKFAPELKAVVGRLDKGSLTTESAGMEYEAVEEKVD